MRWKWSWLAVIVTGASVTLPIMSAPPGAAEAVAVNFDRDIQPILVRCVHCHGPGKAKGGLRLDSRDAVLATLKSGLAAVVPGSPEKSELVHRVTTQDAGERMPPKGEPVTARQIDQLRRWIAAGAPWPSHWAYRPLTRPPAPTPLADSSRTPIDRFILAKLSEHRLAPAAPADQRTLLRRVYFDLIGLAPAAAEMDTFLADEAPDAYERSVDRLLASPHYGERWARHWMDVVHFGETHGHDQDRPREHAWPYRDYLIRAFNADTPYGRFVQEQVAGDALFPDDPVAIAATGFLAAGPWDESSLRDIREDSIDREIGRYLDRDDIVSTVMGTFVSTTIHCARCHDHKFDPIPQEEYYTLQAVFAGIDKANRPYDADPQVAERRRRLAERRAQLVQQKTALDPVLLDSALQDEVAAWEKSLGAAAKYPPALAPVLAMGTELRTSRQRADLAAHYVEQQLERQRAELPAQRQVYCGTSTFAPDGSFAPAKAPRPVHVLRRGDVKQPGALAQPGALSLVSGLDRRFALADGQPEGSRRAALAQWLTDPRNDLTWRSIANRVWQFHFGRGLVDTPNDFGRMGALPTHPELLDWLAVELRDNGGSLKALHRLIVTSAVYRQSSQHRPEFAAIDADNRYLWRMNRVRLDAEAIHDTLLQISGKLDRTIGGPSVKQFIQTPGIHVTPNVDYVNFSVDDPANHRRSVYRFLFRTLPDPLMESLDCPDGSQLTPVRNASVTALQALSMLNDKFVVRQTEHIAQRVGRQGSDLEQQVIELYRLVLGRRPTASEARGVSDYAARHGLANACRVLVNTNEFVFVD